MMMMTIQVEQFIEAVRNRPALWDSHSEDYKDRTLKKDGWAEVCQIMCPDYADRSKEERSQLARDMQLKWKNLRDAYVRHMRMQMDRTRRNKPMRSYIYHAQMQFLRRVINPSARTKRGSFLYQAASSRGSVKTEGEEVDEEEDELTQEDLLEMEQEQSDQSGMEEAEQVPSYMDPLLAVAAVNDAAVRDDEDMNFFKSLLPTLQKLRTEQKLKFRIDVMELLMTYHQSASASTD